MPHATSDLRWPWLRDAATVVAVYFFANIVAGAVIFLLTGEAETIAAGMLAPLLLVPSILFYVVLGRCKPSQPWKHVGYLAPVSLMLGYLVIMLAVDVSGNLAEGNGLPAIALTTIGSTAVLSYLLLLALDRNGREPAVPQKS